MNTDTIKSQFRELKLYTAAMELDTVLAAERKAVHLRWVSLVLEREIDARRERALSFRIKRAEFPEVTTLETFDWDFNPDIDREKIEELATLQFVRERRIALFLGKPGTGKSHLALAIGVKAAQAGLRVYCTSMKKLSQKILEAKARNQLPVLFKKILTAHLWIMDDWGVVALSKDPSEEIFDLLDRRRLSTALLLTSNRDIDEWPRAFHEPVIASAALDRLFDRALLVPFTGESYRLKGRILVRNLEMPEQL
jgi:DNA replication protein DnaC